MDVSNSSNHQISTLHSDALCGSCPSAGSAPQAPSGAGFPAWSGQPLQPAPCWPGQPNTPCWPGQPNAPCWPGQPNTPCWPGTQPAQISVPTPISNPAPTQTLSPAPAPVPPPPQVQHQAPAPVQPCQPYWPGTQCQLPQPQAPVQVPALIPVPTQVPIPSTAPAIHPNIPGWPAHPGWPYNPGQSGWPGQNPSLMPQYWHPPTSGPLSVPYNLNLARGVYDKMMMTILGHVKPNAKMFTVNFLRGNDIAFHINPRFSEGGKQVVVRNHKLGERWGSEERDLKGPFPFALGSPFEMKILCSHEAFRVAVNNIPIFEFRHRVRELNQIDRINILHDVVLTYINVETLP
ncbi:galectin-3-like [Brachionichthys hirsutus]|uniref:galectin-3-like n=1 Tax=Brachionichthys hirsutus TaxID=412623 RepID=UPI00360431C9